MEIFLTYLKVFITGGIICTIGQVLIDKTKLTPARILVLFVVLGVILTGLGIYKPIVDFGGSGATLLAAQRCGRRCRMIELDERYCDTIIYRWETETGKKRMWIKVSRL